MGLSLLVLLGVVLDNLAGSPDDGSSTSMGTYCEHAGREDRAGTHALPRGGVPAVGVRHRPSGDRTRRRDLRCRDGRHHAAIPAVRWQDVWTRVVVGADTLHARLADLDLDPAAADEDRGHVAVIADRRSPH